MIRDRKFYKTFLFLCLPIVLQNMISLGVNLADNLMLGRYAEASLSGVTAANQVQFIYQNILMGVGEGMVILASQYWGGKKVAEMKKVAAVAMWFGVFLMALLFTAVAVTPRGIIGLFSPDDAIIAEGAVYISLIKFTYPVFCVTQMLLALLRSSKNVKIALVLSISTLFINCGINWVLIYGHLGFPAMGVRGAAIGTLTARYVELIILVIYLAARENALKVRLRDFLQLDKRLAADYFRVSLPVILIQSLWGLNTAMQTAILGHLSAAAIAANSMASNLYLMVKTMAIGEASATGVLIGNAIGEGKAEEELKSYARTFQVLFLCIGACCGVLLFLLGKPVLSLYSFSDEARGLARTFINILCIVMVGMCYQMPTMSGVIKGGGDTKFIMAVDLISIWGIVIPLSLFVAFVLNASPVVVVICLNLDQLFKCIPVSIKVNFGHWCKNLTR